MRAFLGLLIALSAFAEEPRRYALALYHFNVEFVAGSRSAEDAVVTESFEPLLDMYLRHPDWGADLEMQGYMVEVLAERHPKVLAKLQKVVSGGRVGIVCCHYADQLVLAFPREDLEWGIAIDDEVLAENGLPRSTVAFFQEGQFGEGLLACLAGNGWKVAVAAKGTYDFWQPKDEAPLLESRGVVVVPGMSRSFAAPDGTRIEVDWTKLGDGEPVATGSNPYGLKKRFRFDPEVLGGYEKHIADREQRGDRIVSVSRYVDEVLQIGVVPSPAKPYLDSPWKGDNPEQVYLWMGRHDQPVEDDVGIHTEVVQARQAVLRATAVAGDSDAEPVVRAWKHLLRAQVSDSTGWAPLPVEMTYAREHAQAAIRAAEEVEGPEASWVDTRTREQCEAPAEPAGKQVDHGPLRVRIEGTITDRQVWTRLREGLHELRVRFTLLPWKAGHGRVVFPSAAGEVLYSPAGLDTEIVAIPWDPLTPDHAYLALPNGLIGVGNDVWVVQDHRAGFSSCRVSRDEVSFEVEGGSRLTHEWRFLVVEGREAALDLALRTNVWPVVPAR